MKDGGFINEHYLSKDLREKIRKEERKKYSLWIWAERATWIIVIAGAIQWERLSKWLLEVLYTIRDIFY